MKTIYKLLALSIILTSLFNIAVSNQGENYSSTTLAKLGLTFTNAFGTELETETLQKHQSSCSCLSNTTGGWVAQSITECQDYEWYPPMVRLTCKLTSCPSGSACGTK
ncbi:hypothetical protein EYV94_11110 [Puteibacter caeruleilacunae]|nr:hypothetical protein EYV94_11110 [Puteibacter caeruleilacunae]